MGEQEMLLRTIQDLEASEHVPRAACLMHCAQESSRFAIGECM